MAGLYLELPPTSQSPYWGNAVDTFASLPVAGAVQGEVVLVKDTKNLYEWTGSAWSLVVAGGSNVIGPASSTDNAVVRFDGTTGQLLQNGVVTIGDTGNVTGIVNLTVTGTTILATALSGPIRAASGTISTGNTSLTTEVSGVLPVANGGTNSGTALGNNRIISSISGAIKESGVTLDGSNNVTIPGSLTISGTSSYIQLPRLTTTQRDALTPTGGFMIYNTTTDRPQIYVAGTSNAWIDIAGWGAPPG